MRLTANPYDLSGAASTQARLGKGVYRHGYRILCLSTFSKHHYTKAHISLRAERFLIVANILASTPKILSNIAKKPQYIGTLSKRRAIFSKTMSSTMRSLTVKEWGQSPVLKSDAPLPPASEGNQTQIRVLASALANVVRSQTTGKHYTVQNAALPYAPGIDGVGLTVPDNKLVYFNALGNKPAPGGAFADFITVDNTAISDFPSLTDATEQAMTATATKVAALMNPSMSSWMAMKYRAHIDDFAAGGREWNALIIGVTSASGHMAALQARYLGASRVIGMARSTEQLEALKAKGVIDIAVPINKEDPSKTDLSLFEKTFPHVILDYVYGPVASAVLQSIPHSARSAELVEARYVHIGTLGKEATFALDGALLRSTNITISGSGPGAWSLKALAKETPAMISAIIDLVKGEGWEDEYGVSKRNLEDAAAAYEDVKARNVFVMV